ncbi:hypothetical protein TYRP_005454 [Tyrophagus putrescentiae]|nr:hypothetical protein TYRP_005454 [Tyrophagus putrescentiae]
MSIWTCIQAGPTSSRARMMFSSFFRSVSVLARSTIWSMSSSSRSRAALAVEASEQFGHRCFGLFFGSLLSKFFTIRKLPLKFVPKGLGVVGGLASGLVFGLLPGADAAALHRRQIGAQLAAAVDAPVQHHQLLVEGVQALAEVRRLLRLRELARG